VQLWDTAGQEKFRSVAKSYFKNADGCIVVYDVNNRMSFKSVPFWMNEFVSKTRNLKSNIKLRPVLVLGNKIDINPKHKQIPTPELVALANEKHVLFDEVSAKKNYGQQIQKSINDLIELLVTLSIFN
jgi:small GTP-binding protein